MIEIDPELIKPIVCDMQKTNVISLKTVKNNSKYYKLVVMD